MSFSPPAFLFENPEAIVILVVVLLLVFGSTKIPKLARSLGSAQKEFKKGIEEGAKDDDASAAVATPPLTPASQPAAVQPPPQTATSPPGEGSPGSGA